MHGTLRDTHLSTSLSTLPFPAETPDFPIVLEQTPLGGGRFALLALLAPALVALMAPFWLVLTQLMSDPAARAILAERPLMGVQLAAGLAALIWILGWPLMHLVSGGLACRRVTIDGGLVRSEAVGRFGWPSWVEPLADYAGVAHRIRTSLSGVRHEVVLVHRRPSRSVVLLCSPQIPQEAVEAAARLFALAEIPSREAASLTPLRRYFGLAEPKPRPAFAGL